MKRVAILLSLVVALALAACAPAAAPAAPAAPAAEATEAPAAEAPAMAEGELPEVNPLEVTGDIITAGSSTVFPLSERMAERFRDEGYADNVTIDSIGTGAGFERFCVAGESDVANASRPIRDSEIESCAAINRVPVEFRVGTDALAVVLNPANDFATEMTVEQIAMAFSTDVTKWNEIDPSWPDAEIKRFSPGTDSGTFDYFVEAVMEETYGDEGETKLLDAANLQLSEDDNILVQGVEGDQYAIGYFGFAYFEEAGDLLQAVNVNGVAPGADAVNSGTYPLARPIFIYSDATIMQEKPQVAAFINFYLTFVNEEVLSVGYFPASEDALNAAKQNWLAAVGQ